MIRAKVLAGVAGFIVITLGALILLSDTAYFDPHARPRSWASAASARVVPTKGASLNPVPLRPAEQELMGSALAVRYDIQVPGARAIAVHYWVDHYQNGALAGRIAEGFSTMITNDRGACRALVVVEALPARAVWDPTCSKASDAAAREFTLIRAFNASMMIAVPSASEVGGSGWRSAGAQRRDGAKPFTFLVGIFDKAFPVVPANFANKPSQMARLTSCRNTYVLRATIEKAKE